MMRIQFFFKHYWPALLSGVLMGTSYIPLPPWAICFCFAPLWIQILRRSTSVRSAFWAGWWTQFLLSLIGFYWVSFVAKEYGYFPWPLALLCLILFAAAVHLYFALATTWTFWLRSKWKLSDPVSLLMLVSTVSLSELWWPSLFPWNLGYTLLEIRSPLAQWADVIGFWGLSLVIHSINALLTYLYLHPRSKSAWGIALGSFVMLGSFSLLGESHARKWQTTDHSLKVLQVQGNIGNIEKFYAERGAGFEAAIAQTYFDLTKKGLQEFPDSELVVWPESAYPDFLDPWEQHRTYSQMFYRFMQEIKTPLLTGAFASDPRDGRPRRDQYNGLFLFDEKGQPVAPAYHKTYLLAYGEYTPGSQWFPWMAKLSPAGTGFGRGPGPTVLNFKENQIGLQICYEGLYPSFTESLSKRGSDLLINLTNDSWFGPTAEPFQHLQMTLARAIESRRPLIRSTNTGISTVILASGEVLEKSPLFQPWYSQYDVKYLKNAEQTFYVKYGAILPWLLLAMLTLVLYRSRAKGKSQ